MKVVFIGDIIGSFGRKICQAVLPTLKKELQPDLIIANGENSAHGYGITEKVYNELIEIGIDVITMGNHVWDKRDLAKNIENLPKLIRPLNYPEGVPGNGYLIVKKNGHKIAVANISGRTFMPPLDCPFQAIDKVLPEIKDQTNTIIVDFHAEATSEKVAMGWFLEGQASAVLGTHTHVMTADERILPRGTAYLSDIGMVGPLDSIIGMQRGPIMTRFLTGMPERFEPENEGPGLFNAVLLEVDPATGKAKSIKLIKKTIEQVS
jgi:2',3'-cyclic-nucleotide 2'-phosphodiesterase